MSAANAMQTFLDEHEIQPEFASAAVVYVPESHEPQAREIEAWARHASRSSGFGAPEALDDALEGGADESLVEILYRVAANLVR
ncbi:MAG TPA: hypothetical protein VNM24_15530 [Burkholderiales bacterium]|jgi:hypothetical protein|nr:hypothetical protein [Burkholderiales bacterium]